MNCYNCKKKGITRATRVFMDPKDRREKGAYRNICDECYTEIMHKKGYRLIDGVWRSQYTEPPGK